MNIEGCGRKVLVVEDDHDVREAIIEVLEDLDYAPITAMNGEEALQRLRAEQSPLPCVILLDLMMPTMDGRAFRLEQEKDATLREVPVVLLTADPDAGVAARQLNTAALLRKPVSVEDLMEVVERYCERDAA